MEGIMVKNRLLASISKLSLNDGSGLLLLKRFCISVNASKPRMKKQTSL
jgi:hypothetical protein